MSLARNVATVGTATLVSRVLGFVRDVLIAAVFGAGIRADAFFVAFQLANLVRRMLGEGTLNAALIPLYLRVRDQDGEEAAARYAGRLIGTLTLTLIAAALVAALLMPVLVLVLAPGFRIGGERLPLAITLARLMLPYLVFAGPLAVLIGVLNANNRFLAAGYVTSVFNLTMLAALVALHVRGAGDDRVSAAILAAAVGVAGLAQLALVASAVLLARLKVTPIGLSFGADLRRFARLAIPGLLAGGIPQITVIAGVMVASTSPNAVSWLYYANRLIELPLGMVGIAIGTVLVPAFVQAVRSGDHVRLRTVESRGLELTLGLSLPAAVALVVLAQPVVQVLFQRGAFTPVDSAATAQALAAFAIGLPGHVLVKAFAPAFFAREDTATPMRAALLGFAVAIVGALLLLPFGGHVGVALAIAASGWASAGFLGWRVARRFGFGLDVLARRRLPRIVLAAVLMGAAVAALDRLTPGTAEAATAARLVVLALLVAAGLGVYGLLLHVLGAVRLGELLRLVRRA